MDYQEFGFLRVRALAPPVALADPAANADVVIDAVSRDADGAAIVLFPELTLTGYSAEDLFFTDLLLAEAKDALHRVASATADSGRIVVVGTPWQTSDGRLLNCGAVLAGGRILGLTPKIYQPNYAEFYEERWFASGAGVDLTEPMPIRPDLLFDIGATEGGAPGRHRFALELCEDLWAPKPPSADHALAGAELILNLSASNEIVAKADYRRDLVRMASARQICAYVYASSSPTESTKDIVFGGHLIAAENGRVVAESDRFDLAGSALTVDLDLDRLRHDRRHNATFGSAPRIGGYKSVATVVSPPPLRKLRDVPDPHPFVPDDEAEFDARAFEIMHIQTTGLARRLLSVGAPDMVIAISGGLDSTLAFLVCVETAAKLDAGPEHVHALTMPGPGTTELTLGSARQLAGATGVTLSEIPIDAAVRQHLDDLGHDGRTHDVVFENAQARERTQILFNYANQHGGVVVGTGDLSELALGWCTFNADHMAGYNVNASVPKTMMAYLVRWYARHRADDRLAAILERVLQTPISPELIPPDGAEISQKTEDLVGPYELHDFFLFHYLRNGFSPAKIDALARLAFADEYEPATIRRWLKTFFSRFFSQQFKRTTLPPGPKVGSVSLSPRGDWRMPDEASARTLLEAIDQLPD